MIINIFRDLYSTGLNELRAGTKFSIILATWWAFITAGDAISTYILLHQGVGYEANPLAAFLFASITKELTLLLSVPLCFLILCLTLGAQRISLTIFIVCLLCLTVKTLAVVNNLTQMAQLIR